MRAHSSSFRRVFFALQETDSSSSTSFDFRLSDWRGDIIRREKEGGRSLEGAGQTMPGQCGSQESGLATARVAQIYIGRSFARLQTQSSYQSVLYLLWMLIGLLHNIRRHALRQ